MKPAILRDPDAIEFAILLALASPALRAEIIADLHKACQRAGIVTKQSGEYAQ